MQWHGWVLKAFAKEKQPDMKDYSLYDSFYKALYKRQNLETDSFS